MIAFLWILAIACGMCASAIIAGRFIKAGRGEGEEE